MALEKTDMPSWRSRMTACVTEAVPAAIKTGLWIIKITVPVSFVVMLLKITGGLGLIARLFEPLFALFGMPGEAALVFATAMLVNIFACIGVIETLGLTGNTVTMLALMCLIAHSLPVESAVQKKTGSSFFTLVAVRIAAAFAGATVLYLMLPADPAAPIVAVPAATGAGTDFGQALAAWMGAMAWLCGKILVLITVLMILQRMLDEFGVIRFLSRLLRTPLLVLGVPHQAAFLWIVANTLGLAYGAGVIIDHVERGHLSREHADILNYHIAISHSLLEDTLLFVAIGASLGWITIPRVILAGVVVWIKRLVCHLRSPARPAASP